ncbi:MAG: M23 family metallopeptidase [Lacisediminihabitans sp.]
MNHLPGAGRVTARRTGALGLRDKLGLRGKLTPRASRLVAILAIVGVVVAGPIVALVPTAAWATSYPSWNDVQNARKSEAAKKAEIATLQGVLAGLEASVTTSQAAAQQKGAEWQTAQQKFDEAAFKATELKKQADDAAAKAKKSKQRAGELAAQLARSGGGDLTATLFFNGDKAANLLSQLGLASKVADQSQGLYSKAVQDQNTAQSLTDQADVAKAALKVLADAAQKALAEAQKAAAAAAAAFAEQQANKARLDAQLATLITNTQHTEAEYSAGLQALWGAGASLGAGQISSSGYARPAGGHISSPFGWRVDPYTGGYALHAGTDLAAGCNTPIYAAHSGTVVYAGPYGGYGNFILVNIGNGITMGYAHIVNGGILVQSGQGVGVGQNIAKIGSTGYSTGCHLHFELRLNGVPQDAVPFMRSNGIELAN